MTKKNQTLVRRTQALSLRGFADVVFRKKWLIVFTLLTAGAVAWAVLSFGLHRWLIGVPTH